MKIIDISVMVGGMVPIWTGDERPVIKEQTSKYEQGIIQTTSIAMNVHTGTHIDAPRHFYPHGGTADQIPLEYLVGKCQVIEILPPVKLITKEDLLNAGINPSIKRLLIKTRNSGLWTSEGSEFFTDYCALDLSAAKYIVECGILLTGIDYLSIAPFANVWDVHQELLSNKVIMLEGLDLSGVNLGEYELYCLPLKLDSKDGLPARAVLMA